jgi:hypothetical protein
MPAALTDSVAVLIVRAWHEAGNQASLRARVTWVMDVEGSSEQTAEATGRDDILACVDRWLDELAPVDGTRPA